MTKYTRNFTAGKMNKEIDERLLPNGEYIDAQNIRIGSTEEDELGVVENSLGNVLVAELNYGGVALSNNALCIGAYEDGTNETIYWFVHDSSFTGSSVTNKLDLIVSWNSESNTITYHVVSMDDGGGSDTTLNFNPTYLITGVDLIENLLFFTDNYNAPRKINITKGYEVPNAGDIDQFSSDEILVIRKPPSESPTVFSQVSPTITSDYMEERFICFGYRWRYDDNEYSATSQFSTPAFAPSNFDFNPDSFLNEGMVNIYNRARVTVKTGSSLVKGIDVLWKDAGDPTIKVLEKLDKADLGIPDNQDYTVPFSDRKIFTILPESEILRLYDNVPRLSQASTIMGNRLMYGNYLEGYDLIDRNSNKTRLEYWVEGQTKDFGVVSLGASDMTLGDVSYSINPIASVTIPNAKASFDMSSVAINPNGTSALYIGTTLTFTFVFEHNSFNVNPVGTPIPGQENLNNSSWSLTFEYICPRSFSSLTDLVSDSSWSTAIGTSANIKPMWGNGGPDSCDGATFTDFFNCTLLNNLGVYSPLTSGITADAEPISTSILGNTISFSFPAVRLVDVFAAPTVNVYEYFNLTDTEATFSTTDDSSSLHSNRGYEVGMVYMDEYNRSTTALVSETNTVHIPCKYSDLKNSIRAYIPPSQIAPSWAKRYKFVVKPDKQKFDTIMSNFSFVDNVNGKVYILLEGENARKVQEGDRLQVKRDMAGELNSCSTVTVLEKKAISGEEALVIDGDGNMPSGAYMIVKSGQLSFQMPPGSIVDFGTVNAETNCDKSYAFVWYPVAVNSGVGMGLPYTIPSNSRITFSFEFTRQGRKEGALCEPREYFLEKTYTSANNYDSFEDWFKDSNIGNTLNQGSWGDTGGNDGNNYFTNTNYISDEPLGGTFCEGRNGGFADGYRGFGKENSSIIAWTDNISGGSGDIQYRFVTGTNALLPSKYLAIRSTISCGSKDKRTAKMKVNIKVLRADNLFVFETMPDDANPDLFYEGADSYAVKSDGTHDGNIQNQTGSQAAIIDLDFFNCYSFGNGVESYKIRDSVAGKDFLLGNRATATAGQDYKEIRRIADITYSGVYNQESNVNKTNEFNLGLLNFKPLEQSFGSIQKMFARETDVLVLQQDKISYILAGKNLLSDASGGGTIASIPEVLGTQIARTEEFGISDNPESFASFGYDKYFTDAKRGSVLQLRGTSAQNETLTVVSEANMSPWFRELFQSSFNYQKLGGYDPYSDEYVLSASTRKLPVDIPCLDCGTVQTYLITPSTPISYCVNVGEISENFVVSYTFASAGTATVNVSYDSVTYTTGNVTTDGTLTIPKTKPKPTIATITLQSTEPVSLTVVVACPVGTPLTVIEVCVTSKTDAGKLIHNQFNFSDSGYVSPLTSSQIQFADPWTNPIISQYDTHVGLQGENIFPSDGATVDITSTQIGDDTYTPALPDELSYLRTSAFYANTLTDISALLLLVNATALTTSPTTITGDFTMPAGADEYLYIIYDYRDRTEVTNLCFAATAADACCGCVPSGTYYLNGATLITSTAIFSNSTLTTAAANGFYSDGQYVVEQTGAPSAPILSLWTGCPSCVPFCDVDIASIVQGLGGIYKMAYDVGASGNACVVVTFTPNSIPNGIKVTAGGPSNLIDFKLSSENFGKLESTSGNYTLCGTASSACITTPDTTSYSVFDWENGNWINSGTPQNATLEAGDEQYTVSPPGKCSMVIPSYTPVSTFGTLNVEVISPCLQDSPSWSVSVQCPALIPATNTSSVNSTSVGACGLPTGTDHYFVAADGTIGGAPTLHAFVFTDNYGLTPAADGWIAYFSNKFQISDGIIIATGAC